MKMPHLQRISAVLAVVAAGLVAAHSRAAASSASTPRPRLIALAYGRFRPQGATKAYLALRLTAQQPGGQILETDYQEVTTHGRPDGVGGSGDGECGIGGRHNGTVEVSFLPVGRLGVGTHRIRVDVVGSTCTSGSSLSRASRVFVLKVR